jgi:colanic acid/amylovoran biosynthesis glycosyltransferase
MRMRLAYLTNQYPAVSHTFIRREIEGLERLGAEVFRFSLRVSRAPCVDAADREEALRTESFEKSAARLAWSLAARSKKRPRHLARAALHATRLGLRSPRGVARHAGYLVAAAHLAERCEALRIDHVHAHFGTNSAAIAMLAHELGGPGYSFTIHGPEEFDDVWGLSLPEKIARARFVIAVSDFGKSQIYRHVAKSHWPRVEVLRCSVGDSFIRTLPTTPPADLRLVTIGRLSMEKGHLLLVEAAAELVRAGLPLELVFVGDGELRPELEASIARHGLPERVRITGWASGDQVRGWLERSRALVLPSFGEGLPVVLMEALAAGRPVVTTSIAGIPELVETGKNGVVVPAGSTAALRDGMRAVLEAPTERLAEMGAEGRRRVLALHHPGRNARALLELFERYVGRERLEAATSREPAALPADATCFESSA